MFVWGVGDWVGGGGVRVEVNGELKFLGKFSKKKNRGGVGWGRRGGVRWGGQGGCERRIEVYVKFIGKFKKEIGGGGGVRGGGEGLGRGGGGRLGGQGGCERRIEVFGKIHKKKNRGGQVGESGWWGVRVDVNDELKLL